MTDAELRVLAMIEGRPLPQSRALSEQLGVSQFTAWRLITRLHQRGISRVVAAVNPEQNTACECVAYLRVSQRDAEAARRLEAALKDDPQVHQAVWLTGRDDLCVRSFHPGAAEAAAWHKALLSQAAVVEGRYQFCRTLFRRLGYAAALLSPTPPDA